MPATAGKVDFISDLHLDPRLARTAQAFATVLQDGDDDALFILGDLFEVWIGDDAMDQPFEARCVDWLRAATHRRPVYLLPGNRDFLLGPRFFEATGVQALQDPCTVIRDDERGVVSHGDALCLADTAYQGFRAQVRQPDWQQAFLARPWAERDAMARQMREASREHQREPADYADADAAAAATEAWLDSAKARWIIHGHTHRPADHVLPSGRGRHVLCDWDLDGLHSPTPRAEALRWTPEGFQRRDLSGRQG